MRILRNLSISLLALASLSSATVVTFTDRPTWEAASSGITNVDFESLGITTYASYSTSAGLTTGGLTFVGVVDVNTYFLYALNPPDGAGEDFDSLTVLKGPAKSANSYLSVLLPLGTKSFGLDLGTYDPGAQGFRIELDGIDVGLLITTQARPTRTFFGATSTNNITEVKIRFDSTSVGGPYGIFDNIAYGSLAASGGGGGGGEEPPPAETPEAATLLCVGSGLLMMRFVKRRAMPAIDLAS